MYERGTNKSVLEMDTIFKINSPNVIIPQQMKKYLKSFYILWYNF